MLRSQSFGTPPSGPTMMARVVKALNRHVELVFNPERKDTHWRETEAQGRALQNYILIEVVGLPIRIRNAVKFAGLKTIGDLRETADEAFANIPNLGPGVCQMAARSLARRSSNDVQRRAFGWPTPYVKFTAAGADLST